MKSFFSKLFGKKQETEIVKEEVVKQEETSFIVPDKIEDVPVKAVTPNYNNDIEKYVIEEAGFVVDGENFVKGDVVFNRKDQSIQIKRGNLSIITPEITDLNKLNNYLRKYSK